MAITKEEQELIEYRDLMVPPTRFDEGFNIKTVIGALFIGFVMMPGAIYLGLIAGETLGPAAEWVTIILFLEIAKRSFTILKRQEIYILYYIASGLMVMTGIALYGGPFATFIWNQFLVQSPAAASFAKNIPDWVSPPANSPGIVGRNFFHHDWRPAILILLATQILGRLNWFGLGYVLFRLTSDVERLPFPLAPVTAQGATALAEASAKEETWRWRIFSIGAMIGVAFGAIYVGVPAFTSVVMIRPLYILPIPFIEFTQSTESFLPAATTGITANIGAILIGFVLPFWIVIGRFIAAFGSIIINPILYKTGVLHTWQPGMDAFHTTFSNWLDFWLSFGIGAGVSVAFVGIFRMIQSQLTQRAQQKRITSWRPPKGRGDIPISLALGIFIVSTVGYIWLCHKLVPKFPWIFFVGYGFIWTPFISYVNARMVGLTGQFVGFPMVREATFILSGYKGVEIWFAPIPLASHGLVTQSFRQLELTGTKITSLIKAEILMFPIIMFCSLLFWQFIWRLGPIPSVRYPYAQKYWNFYAMQSCFWITAAAERQELFLQALKPQYLLGGLGFGIISYSLLSYLGLPTMLIYGFISAINVMPHFILPEIIGALLGRYYFAKRFGAKPWQQYSPVLLAGFACGMGLISMCGISILLVSFSISKLPY